MNYTLMHKKKAVAELTVNTDAGIITKINKVYEPAHLPVGTLSVKGTADRYALNKWWEDRSIPSTRSGIREALETLRINNTKELLIRCYGLSLSDQYWICPANEDISWESVNYFQNDFSDDIGDVLFGTNKKSNAFDFSSPDNTSDGNLKKRWKIIGGKRCLVKGGSNPFRQQPFNEVIASEIMRRLDIPHIPYTVMWNKGAPYSVCEDFVDENTELISAWRIFNTQKKDNNVSVYSHFVKCCETLGIKGAVLFLDRMITVDWLIANEDRHLNNFGVLRNADTLEWIGFAPIYDSGSSLGYDKLPSQIISEKDIVCKPFKKRHSEQIKSVQSFSWLNTDKLSGISETVREILSDENAAEFIDENRVNAIAVALENRVNRLTEIIQSFVPTEQNTVGDVEGDTAESYSEITM